MKLLLDTHIFLWYITKDRRLDPDAERAIRQPENQVFLSSVSLWECLVKHRLGKLPQPPEEYLPFQRQRHAISPLPVDEAEVRHLAKLPDLHRDPFDRMLICQALEYDLTLMTVDRAIKQYPVTTFQIGH
ncbi:MAG: type II toxin-antitoxin system VapC family toxin [Candidatus Hydrogenedentes bacterium]|nr:type II toxin-antitoxin system VapC family toxin [Candidatus Hydrogenedentota bacterium]